MKSCAMICMLLWALSQLSALEVDAQAPPVVESRVKQFQLSMIGHNRNAAKQIDAIYKETLNQLKGNDAAVLSALQAQRDTFSQRFTAHPALGALPIDAQYVFDPAGDAVPFAVRVRLKNHVQKLERALVLLRQEYDKRLAALSKDLEGDLEKQFIQGDDMAAAAVSRQIDQVQAELAIWRDRLVMPKPQAIAARAQEAEQESQSVSLTAAPVPEAADRSQLDGLRYQPGQDLGAWVERIFTQLPNAALSDPQFRVVTQNLTALLAEAGSQVLPFLTQRLPARFISSGAHDSAILSVLPHVISAQDKAYVLEQYARGIACMADPIIRFGWESEAADSARRLLERIIDSKGKELPFMPGYHVNILAQNQREADIPLIVSCFRNPKGFHQVISALDGWTNFPMAMVLEQVWPTWLAEADASTALAGAWVFVRAGKREALDRLLALAQGPKLNSFDQRRIMWTLREYTNAPANGTLQEALQWWQANQGKISFDPKSTRWLAQRS